jgi:hypothetical protein
MTGRSIHFPFYKTPSPLAGEGCVGLANEVSLAGVGGGGVRGEPPALGRAQLSKRLCGGTPHPNLPPQGGKGLAESGILVHFLTGNS